MFSRLFSRQQEARRRGRGQSPILLKPSARSFSLCFTVGDIRRVSKSHHPVVIAHSCGGPNLRAVACVHGGSHHFRIDQPFLDSRGKRLENFTGVETFGDNQADGNNDARWS